VNETVAYSLDEWADIVRRLQWTGHYGDLVDTLNARVAKSDDLRDRPDGDVGIGIKLPMDDAEVVEALAGDFGYPLTNG
jgi:hypothetical protein